MFFSTRRASRLTRFTRSAFPVSSRADSSTVSESLCSCQVALRAPTLHADELRALVYSSRLALFTVTRVSSSRSFCQVSFCAPAPRVKVALRTPRPSSRLANSTLASRAPYLSSKSPLARRTFTLCRLTRLGVPHCISRFGVPLTVSRLSLLASRAAHLSAKSLIAPYAFSSPAAL